MSQKDKSRFATLIKLGAPLPTLLTAETFLIHNKSSKRGPDCPSRGHMTQRSLTGFLTEICR
jgi:hypothetical protein